MATLTEPHRSPAPPPPDAPLPGPTAPGEGGASTGLNIEPGSHDDGWVVPDPVRLADGSLIQLYKDGEALHAAYEAIKAARHRICLEMYIFSSDPTGRAFADLLAEKARQGVRVYLIYDSFGSIASDPNMFHAMARAGVRVKEFHPFWPWEGKFSWRPINRNHRKLLVIDNDIAGLGGLNLAGEYAGSWVVPTTLQPCEFWRDNAIGIKGPAAQRLLQAFASTWRYVTRRGRMKTAEYLYNLDAVCDRRAESEDGRWKMEDGGRRGEDGRWRMENGGRASELAPSSSPSSILHSPSSPPSPPSSILHSPSSLPNPPAHACPDALAVLASAPTRHSPLRPFLNKLFREAQHSISMSMAYFAPHDDLIDELCAAARRGVRVRLMLPGRCDIRALLIAARSFYETLLSAGVQVYERENVILHAKTMVIDGRISMIGSTNLDYRSIEYNLELSALIRSAEFGRQMEALFENDIHFARRMTLNKWRHRPRFDRIVQWAVSRARYLL